MLKIRIQATDLLAPTVFYIECLIGFDRQIQTQIQLLHVSRNIVALVDGEKVWRCQT